jgi:hypothetical protein
MLYSGEIIYFMQWSLVLNFCMSRTGTEVPSGSGSGSGSRFGYGSDIKWKDKRKSKMK